MTTYTVHILTKVGSRQLLLINDSNKVSLAVYCEHSGQTLLRMTDVTIENLKTAIALLESGE
jgi:hypothetical protein